MLLKDTKQFAADAKFFESYSRYDDDLGRYESWEESVDRVMTMHRQKYADKLTPALEELMDFVEEQYKGKRMLGAQRALQFGGEQILKHEAKLYNCTAGYLDRLEFFGEYIYLLLCGAGVGFSVQRHHIEKLPKMFPRTGEVVQFEIGDSIEGWAEAIDVLFSSFGGGFGKYPDYNGKKIYFDYSKIRPKGSKISGGFKAPGPEPLRKCINICEDILTRVAAEDGILKPIHAYDLSMHIADAVISGGVRRAATIALFSKDDEEMLNAKTGSWFIENPQRARSNNSVILVRDETTLEDLQEIANSIKEFGEPGFILTDNKDFVYNPCLTGDALVTVRDHDVTREGEHVAQGLEYQIPLAMLVDLYEQSSILPMIKTVNTETGEVEWQKLAGAVLTRKNAEVFEVTDISTGRTIKATADHLIWTRNRGYVKVCELKEDDSLMIESEEGNEKGLVVKNTRNEDVYDIAVENNHNFFANGILVHNCVEIGMLPVTEDGESGFQACNLCEINGLMCNTEEDFYEACKAAAILGTLQAGYTNFRYLSPATQKIVEREALLGVSITGWMNNPHILFDEKVMKKGAEIVKEWNRKVSEMIGINQAARTTCVKPSGNSSVLLQTANGIHGEHSPMYFRHVQMSKDAEVSKLIKEYFPEMIEDSVWSPMGTEYCIAFPFVASENSIFKNDLLGVKQLEYVKKAQQNWVEHGTNEHLCVDERNRHNVSNTITVDDWDEVIEYVHDNKQWFAGISFIPMSGDKDYAQAPNAQVLSEEEIIEKYGSPALFASGLICQGLDTFNNDLWLALSTVIGQGLDISADTHENSTKREFVKRFKRFAEKYFASDIRKCIDCLKDVYYLHKWEKIQLALRDKTIDWTTHLTQKQFTDVDTMGAVACSGVKGCEI